MNNINSKKLDFCSEDDLNEMLDYLDNLRESGVVSMFGAIPYIQKEFRLDREKSSEVFWYWADCFSQKWSYLYSNPKWLMKIHHT